MESIPNRKSPAQALVVSLMSSLISTTAFGFNAETADQKVLSQLITSEYTRAINAENADEFADLFTDDAVRASPGRLPEATKSEIRSGMAKVFGVFDFDVAVELFSMEIDGDFALVHGIGRGSRSKTSEGKETKFAARAIWLCKRIDGNWRIWRQVWYPIKKAK